MKNILIAAFFTFILAITVYAENNAPSFKDIPAEHWASEAVAAVQKAGIMRGYPDATFKGDKCVTRYELAAALAGLAQFFQESRKPLVDEKKEAPKQKALAPAKKAETNPVKWLIDNKYLPANTILRRDKNKPVNAAEIADAAAAVIARACELDVVANPPKPLATEKDWQ